jgi:hypothetical protein
VASATVAPFPKADIAKLPDSDGDNGIVDVYDELTRHDTIKPERGPFKNYVVSIFSVLLLCTDFYIKVHNYDYCCTGDTSWIVHK